MCERRCRRGARPRRTCAGAAPRAGDLRSGGGGGPRVGARRRERGVRGGEALCGRLERGAAKRSALPAAAGAAGGVREVRGPASGPTGAGGERRRRAGHGRGGACPCGARGLRTHARARPRQVQRQRGGDRARRRPGQSVFRHPLRRRPHPRRGAGNHGQQVPQRRGHCAGGGGHGLREGRGLLLADERAPGEDPPARGPRGVPAGGGRAARAAAHPGGGGTDR